MLDELKHVDTDQVCIAMGECSEEDDRSSTLESFNNVATVTGEYISAMTILDLLAHTHSLVRRWSSTVLYANSMA